MTLIVTLQGIDGLVLAGDSRGTIGDPRGLTAINDSFTKLFRLSKYCGIGISGASELGATIIDTLNKQIGNGKLEYTDDILKETRSLIRSNFDDWFNKFPVNERPAMNISVVGYTRNQDDSLIPRTFLLSSQLDFAPQLFPNGNCLHGVPQYAVYLMHRLYDSQMTVDSLSRLAAYLIAETATQDPKVGGPIRIAKITQNEGYLELDTKEVEEITKLNSEQNDKLKQFFFGGGHND